MALLPGTRIGSYEIVGLLGTGGMGEVYRARDARLGRDVAIKVLGGRLAHDELLLTRIEREARLLASLNHPNIATIHGVEDWQGTPAIVMEMIEGETLAVRLMDGALPVAEVVRIARQMADALTAAHDRGIVHRDFKPANVHIRPDGGIKVLDFGLAKSVNPLDANSDTNGAIPVTTEGAIMGTAPYMSPEQARGVDVDRRSDIWSFGCTVFELLAGVRPFQRATPADTIVAILSTDPDWTTLPAGTPDGVRLLLQRCLQRDPRQRLRDLADASFALEASDIRSSAIFPKMPRPVMQKVLIAAVPILVVMGLAGVGVLLMRPGSGEAPLRKFEVQVDGLGDQPGTFAGESGPGAGVLISPDGRRIVYPAAGQLWVRELSALVSKPLDGTEKAVSPTWDPRSNWVAYVVGDQLRKSPISGGSAVTIATVAGGFAEAGGVAWSDEGTLSYTTGNGPLWKVSAEGGNPEKVIEVDPNVLDYHDAVIAGGRVMFITHYTANQFSVDVIDEGKRRVVFGPVPHLIRHAALSRSGHLVFQRIDNPGVWAVPVDARTLATRGEPFLVASGGLRPSVAADGTLVYVTDESWGKLQFSMVDRAGKILTNIGDARRGLRNPALSPSGDRVVFAAPSTAGDDLWVLDVAHGSATQLTFTGVRGDPAWHPDGRGIAYSCGVTGAAGGVCLTSADGGTEPAVAVPGASQPHFSPDGKYLAYILLAQATRTDVWTAPLDRSKPAQLIKQSPAFDFMPRISPDGLFVAYASSESGKPEVYIADFPEPRRRWQVSTTTGAEPKWSNKPGELFYLDVAGQLQSVAFDAAGRAGKPQPLFRESDARAHLTLGYAPAANGQQFLVVRDVDRGTIRPRITVVENWFAEFTDR